MAARARRRHRAHRADVVHDGADAGDGFFKNPAAVKLRIPVRRIEWKLDRDSFTPDIPENSVVLPGGEEVIELVPYGATMLRLSVFPEIPAQAQADSPLLGRTKRASNPDEETAAAKSARLTPKPWHSHNTAILEQGERKDGGKIDLPRAPSREAQEYELPFPDSIGRIPVFDRSAKAEHPS